MCFSEIDHFIPCMEEICWYAINTVFKFLNILSLMQNDANMGQSM